MSFWERMAHGAGTWILRGLASKYVLTDTLSYVPTPITRAAHGDLVTPRGRRVFAFQIFRHGGMEPLGAAATVGNLCQEAGLGLQSRETVKTDHGSQGIAQWRLERLTALKEFAATHDVDWQTLETQCAFLLKECRTGYPALWDQLTQRNSRTVENLTANFCFVFERPSKRYAYLDKRIAYAKQVLREVGGHEPV